MIASNSSSYGINEILEGLELRHKKRILSAHCCKLFGWLLVLSDADILYSRLASGDIGYVCSFMIQPAFWLYVLTKTAIEIMGHEEADPSNITLLMEQCKEHGFSPFHVKKSSIGYIYNR